MRLNLPGVLSDRARAPSLPEGMAERPLPRGLSDDAPVLRYGPYLLALWDFFRQRGWSPLRDVMAARLKRDVGLHEIHNLELSSEKHGAFYHVARLRAEVGDERPSFAVNCAVTPSQRALSEREFDLLRRLHATSGGGFIPCPYLSGQTTYAPDSDEPRTIDLFVVEWFDGFHEFHLAEADGGEPVIHVWDGSAGGSFLSGKETASLYRKTAHILTSCLDPADLSEVYPWHHAAGDFIVRRHAGDEVDVRLITVRDHRRVCPFDREDAEAVWACLLMFFLNLTLHVRLDRLEGTGELALADPAAIASTVEGFFDAWDAKAEEEPELPDLFAVQGLFRSLTPQDWLGLVESLPDGYFADEEEVAFLANHLVDHVEQLTRALRL